MRRELQRPFTVRILPQKLTMATLKIFSSVSHSYIRLISCLTPGACARDEHWASHFCCSLRRGEITRDIVTAF